MFRQRLAEEGGVRRLLDGLRKQAYVSVRPEAIDLTPLPHLPTRDRTHDRTAAPRRLAGRRARHRTGDRRGRTRRRASARRGRVFTSSARANAGIDVDEHVGEWPAEAERRGARRPARRCAPSSAPSISRCAATVDGIVTAPLDKHALLAGGYDYPGHTEMLAARTGRAGRDDARRHAAERGHAAIRCASCSRRRTSRCATCPHRSPRETIVERRRASRARDCATGSASPSRASRSARSIRMPATADASAARTTSCSRPPRATAGIAGPFPADTVFVRAMRGEFDAVIAPYHDVGMTAIKVAAFGSRGERHAGPSVPAHVARSRHGARHRGAGASPTRRA